MESVLTKLVLNHGAVPGKSFTITVPSLFLFFCSTQAFAAIDHDFTLAASAIADSNPRMVEDDEESIWRAQITPDYKLNWIEDNNQIITQVRLRLEQSSDTNVSQNREDPLVSMEWINSAPTGEFRLKGAYEESSTRFSEFDDTGLVFADATRTNAGVTAGWIRSLTERMNLSVNAGYSDVSYDGGLFTDYELADASVNLSYQMSPVTTPYIQVYGSQYETDDPMGVGSDMYGMRTGFDWQLSPLLSVNVNVGVVEVDRITSDTNMNGGASLTYSAERFTADLSFSHSTQASGFGGYVESDSVRTSLTYAYSPLVNIGGSLNWRQNDTTGTDNESALVELWASRTLSESWSTRFSWQYKQQNSNFESYAHILMLSLRYTLP